MHRTGSAREADAVAYWGPNGTVYARLVGLIHTYGERRPMPGQQMSWLLALVAGSGPDDPLLDPIRIQKGLFLLQQENVVPRADRYHYQPYSYGPAAFGIYDDLRTLEAEELVEVEPLPGHTYSVYRATPLGRRRAEDFRRQLKHHNAAKLDETRRTVASLSFRDLLEHVYSRYPKYAEKSVVSLR